YDATGNWKTPKTLRIKMLNNGGTGPARLQKIAIKDFKFYEDYTLVANKAPVANAGPDTTITLPSVSTTLNGFASDSDGVVVSYSWVQLSGISLSGLIGTPTTTSTLISALLPGVYQYELTVTDDLGAIGKDTVQITVNALSTGNLLPAVNPVNIAPGLNYSYYEGSWNMLPDFTQLTPFQTGTSTKFSIAAAGRTSQYAFDFTGYIDVPSDGIYTFYTSSDDGSSLDIDKVAVVSNDGVHGTIEKSGTIGLKAGKHLISSSYFQSMSGATFTVSYDGPGVLKQIIPASRLYRINTAPVANAGSNITIVLPANTTTLRGSGVDTDGTVSSYSWKKISGRVNDIITSPNSATTTLTNLAYGQYQYALTVTDNDGLSATDLIWVTVDSANAVHSAPVGRAAPVKSTTPAATTPVSTTPAVTPTNDTTSSVTNTSPVNTVVINRDTIAGTRNKFDISDLGSGNSLKIYPNPVKDFANLAINSSGKGKKLSISVYNASGMLVDFKELSAVQANLVYRLDISHLNGGIYTVRVRFDTGDFLISKLVKN
ncbi:MAG: T9SS type A sorting domain-containing protein, partial [Ferruginibacter sp.]